MPRISELYGILIAMVDAEHGVPHFHAHSAGREASAASIVAVVVVVTPGTPRVQAVRRSDSSATLRATTPAACGARLGRVCDD